MVTSCTIIGRVVSIKDERYVQVAEEMEPGDEWLKCTFPVDISQVGFAETLLGKLLKFECVLSHFRDEDPIKLLAVHYEEVKEERRENE